MESRFERAGSLERPGVIGRAVRLLLGIVCLRLFWVHVTDGGAIASAGSAPSHAGWWLGVVVGIYVFSYVVNIGFSLSWGRWPLYAVLLLGIGLVLWGWLESHQIWTPALGWLVVVWMTYTFGHLGVSFVLSSLLATPGCEMRAIPHLFTKVTGRESSEHFCPGPLRWVDEWELERARRRADGA